MTGRARLRLAFDGHEASARLEHPMRFAQAFVEGYVEAFARPAERARIEALVR